ncbi:MAG: glycoside hydrolase family 2 TIM barrel-domain containing protein [Vicinamibacterales bacterium]
MLSSADLDAEGRAYPRPQLQRRHWFSLNGVWECALDPDCRYRLPADVQWSEQIRVPFAPETGASGLSVPGYLSACWYRQRVTLDNLTAGDHWLLHFGAVDFRAVVWINGIRAGEHLGGYTPFTIDITEFSVLSADTGTEAECAPPRRSEGPRGEAGVDGDAPFITVEIIVRADDDPLDLMKPRGKQDWQLDAHSIWYQRTTGIWQTVWLERVPVTRIERLAFTPDLVRWEIGIEVWLSPDTRTDLRLGVKLTDGDVVLASDTYNVIRGEVHRGVAMSDPGIDDSRNELLWSPESPHLITVQLQLWGARGELLDEVSSYAALRSITTRGDRFLLNGRPYLLRMVLDQGYWPDSGLTAPNDEAFQRDINLTRAMGFNGVRKHQKIEDPRYLYWADRIGLLVWGEMPSAYRFTQQSVDRLSREWAAAVQRDCSHPCIAGWVPINESWGVPNLPDTPRERHYVQALYHLTKTLDPTRPVIGNDGWESVATDIVGIHDYDSSPERIARRYRADDALPRLFKRERPGGRLLVLEGQPSTDLPVMLTEFGGIRFAADPKTWGYLSVASAEDFERQYTALLKVVRSLGVMSGFCYTQFADTYQEANGLLYADRTPKFPIDRIARATAGTAAAARRDGLDQISLTDQPERR